jgi:glutathione S-transferase
MAHLEVPQVPEWGEANVAKVETMLDLLNDELASREYVAGDDYSVADITALCTIDFMKVARIALADHHEHLKRWRETVSARASAQA